MRRASILIPLAVLLAGLGVPRDARAIPAWARRYNAACTMCHYPVPPHLNSTGLRFRWAGYRMADDFGRQVDVTQVSNYFAVKGRVQYHYDKVEGRATDQSSFSLAEASLFYGGPFGTRYAAFFQIEHLPTRFDVIANVQGTWGRAGRYAGLRVGQMHWGPQVGVAGFDRVVGIATPIPISRPLTAAIPFGFPAHQLGAEAFVVQGRNRFSVSALNGVDSSGSASGEDADTWKDIAVMHQVLLDQSGSGAVAMAYYGTTKHTVPGFLPGQAHFWRLAASANKILHHAEALGGVVWGRDLDMPTGRLSPFTVPNNTALGYWFSGQYYLPTAGVAYARYERIDPSTTVPDDASTRLVGGLTAPIGVPQYLHLTLEYWIDLPQYRIQKKTHHVAGEVRLVF